MADLTVADRLLISALALEGDEESSFTAEQLVVSAWKRFPESFGLRGILDAEGSPRYPDSNRVFAEIMGSKPLRKNGYMEKVGDKTYRLTHAGRQRAMVLAGRDDDSLARRSLSRGLQDSLRRLSRTRAVEKYGSGRQMEITFLDACGYWGISPRSSAMDLEAKLAGTAAVIGEVSDYAQGNPVQITRSEVITSEDIQRLAEVHDFLQERFVAELMVIRARTDER
jgi:hypothetical protein